MPMMRGSIAGVGLGVVLIALALAPGHRAQAADVYTLDDRHTEIRLRYDHFGLSTQSGRFLRYEGRLTFDKARPEASTLEVTIDAASLTTDVPDLDERLHGADFFDVEAHPKITFRSTSAVQTGANLGQVTGDLTIKGVTRPVTLDVRLNFVGDHPLAVASERYQGARVAGFSARAKVLRSAFGLGKDAPLTSDEVVIEIEAELLSKP